MKFSHTLLVSQADIDAQDHVNNVAYVRWIQDVAVAHWFAATSAETREKLTWIVTRHEIDYKKQAFEGDEVTVTTWVGKATKVTCERFTEIRRGENLLVQARSIWCLIDKTSGRPVKIDLEIRESFKMQ